MNRSSDRLIFMLVRRHLYSETPTTHTHTYTNLETSSRVYPERYNHYITMTSQEPHGISVHQQLASRYISSPTARLSVYQFTNSSPLGISVHQQLASRYISSPTARLSVCSPKARFSVYQFTDSSTIWPTACSDQHVRKHQSTALPFPISDCPTQILSEW